MARTTETLVGGQGGDWGPEDMNAAILQQMRSRQQARFPGGMFLNEEARFSVLMFDKVVPASSISDLFPRSGMNHQIL
jgi:hypothetical protein